MRYSFALSVFVLSLIVLLGCDKKNTDSKSDSTKKEKEKSVATVTGGAGANSSSMAKEFRTFADSFLKDLTDGKAKASDLSPSFKKLVGTPITEEERKVGYSDPETEAWLRKNFEGAKFTINREPNAKDTYFYHGRVEKDKSVGAFALWVTREASQFKVTWICKTERFLPNPPETSGETLIAAETVQAFLDNLLGGELRFSLALTDESYKVKLAPPTDDQKTKGLTYDPGFVQVKLRAIKGDYYEYKLMDIKTETVTGIWIGANSVEKPFTIKLTQKGGGLFVSDLELK